MSDARARLVREDAITHPVLLALPPCATILWIGLVLLADDSGEVVGDGRWLVRRLFPGRKIAFALVESWLARWLEEGMVEFVTRGSVRYVRLRTFAEHQRLRSRSGRKRSAPADPSSSPVAGFRVMDRYRRARRREPTPAGDLLPPLPAAPSPDSVARP